MFKKALIGSTIIILIGGYIYSSNKYIKELENKNDILEIKIEKIKKEIDSKTKIINQKNKIIKELEEENKKLEEENKKLKNEIGKAQEFILTFYTTLPQENGGYTTTCLGEELRNGMVASNVYPLGTKIKINGKIFTVSDRGGKNFNNYNRLDVLVERESGESNQEYLKRVNNLGKIKVTGYILNK